RVTDFGHDLRVTMRGLGRRPAFTILAVVMLALGIGGSAAFWTVVRQMLRAPFDVPERERVVHLWLENPDLHLQIHPPGAAAMVWRARRAVFEVVEPVALGSAVASVNGESESVATASISAGFLRFAGRTPALGRAFDLGDEGGTGQPAVMLSYGWWQRRYGADPGVLGKVVQVDGVSRVITGVMPASLARVPGADQTPDLWLPTPPLLPNDRQFVTLARIRAGMPKERVQAELASAAAEIGRLDPRFAKWHWSMATAKDVLGASNLLTLRILFIAAGMILLVGCVNVSHLLLGRTLARRTEFTIRSALGASRWRLIGLGAVEAGTLGVCAGLVGIAVAYLAVGILVHFRPSRMERLDSVHMDAAALAVSVGLGLFAALAASLVPMLQLGRDHAGVPQSGTRHSSGREAVWLRGALITLEVALALPMLIGAGLMARSFWRLRNSDVGFSANGLVAVNLQLPSWRFRNAGDSAAFLTSVTAAVRQLPGVQQVSRATGVPPRSGVSFGNLSFEGAPELTDANPRMLASNHVAPDYFQALGMTLVEGRGFDPTVAAGEVGVVIINRSMARRYWPAGGAIGHRLKIGDGEYARIIGVVSDVAALGVGTGEGDMQLYRPLDMTAGEGLLVVRSNLPYETLVGMVRRSVRSINAEVPAEVSQLSAYLDADIA
ncbi:MAG: ABC transporter permease, partial [Gemmatimonadales bacterium]